MVEAYCYDRSRKLVHPIFGDVRVQYGDGLMLNWDIAVGLWSESLLATSSSILPVSVEWPVLDGRESLACMIRARWIHLESSGYGSSSGYHIRWNLDLAV